MNAFICHYNKYKYSEIDRTGRQGRWEKNTAEHEERGGEKKTALRLCSVRAQCGDRKKTPQHIST